MRTFLLTVALLFAPRLALACPVCFGQSDSPMAQGVNMGIYVLLGVTGAVLTAFASFIIYLVRRARLFADEVSAAPADRHVRVLEPQEGTGQC